MDAETWRAVMVQFASQNLTAGSPLRTLYSLFAGAGTAVFDDDTPAAPPPPPRRRRAARWARAGAPTWR
jgi:hypothetical protein